MTKARAQRIHAQRRAVERFGIHLSRKAMDRMIQEIQSGRAQALEPVSNRLRRFLFTLEGKEAVVLYDRNRKTIVTLMPPEWLPSAEAQTEGR